MQPSLASLLPYLKATGREHGLLLNFATPTLEIKRVSTRTGADLCRVPGFLLVSPLSGRVPGARLAAAIHWYSQELISQGKAAEVAGMGRIDFLEELFRRRIPAVQVTAEELREELAREE